MCERTRLWTVVSACVALVAACGDNEKRYTCEQDLHQEAIPCHPYLADSPWPITHQSPYCQASSSVEGPMPGDSLEVEYLPSELVSITLAFSGPYPDGGRVIWGSSAVNVYKVDITDGAFELVDSVDKSEGFDNFISGAYALVDADGVFYEAESQTIDAFTDEVKGDPSSPISRRGRYELPDPAVDESVIGLSMTWDGVLVFATSTSRVGALTRDLEELDMVQLGNDEEVSNSIAVDENGGIYVVTSKLLYRVQWTGRALSVDPADGAWSATYEVGPEEPIVGRLGIGSGSTPSLMGTGEQDRFVVITDGRQLMHLVFFWRDEIPPGWEPVRPGADPRVAGEIPVTYGSVAATSSFSEQSVLVSGYRAVVVNNDYGPVDSQLEPILTGMAPPGVEQFEWDEGSKTVRSVWSVPDVSCPNGIPGMSRASGLMYCIGRRDEQWTLEMFDWETGQVLHTEVLGRGPNYNSAYAGAEVGPDGAFYSGTFSGLVRVGTAGYR